MSRSILRAGKRLPRSFFIDLAESVLQRLPQHAGAGLGPVKEGVWACPGGVARAHGVRGVAVQGGEGSPHGRRVPGRVAVGGQGEHLLLVQLQVVEHAH